jgi:tetratricopeptide (TPR) repeat protein
VGEIAEAEHSAPLEAAYAGGLGETWFAAGDLTRAEPLLRRSLRLLREDQGAAPSQIAVALALMAHLYIEENKLALAEEALDEAIEKDEGSLGPGHPQLAILLELRADLLSRRGQAAEAREDLEKARGIMSTHFGPKSTAVAGVLAEFGDVELRSRRPDAAVAKYELARECLRDSGADGARFGPAILARYVAALKAAHRSDEAKALVSTGAVQSFHTP